MNTSNTNDDLLNDDPEQSSRRNITKSDDMLDYELEDPDDILNDDVDDFINGKMFGCVENYDHDFMDDDYHLKKTEECLLKNINLIHIFEDEWVLKKDIVKARLRNFLNKNELKIFGRETYVKEIDVNISRNFLENNSFEIEDDYFNGLFELSCIEEMSLMSNLSVKDKESIKSRLETGKKLVK